MTGTVKEGPGTPVWYLITPDDGSADVRVDGDVLFDLMRARGRGIPSPTPGLRVEFEYAPPMAASVRVIS